MRCRRPCCTPSTNSNADPVIAGVLDAAGDGRVQVLRQPQARRVLRLPQCGQPVGDRPVPDRILEACYRRKDKGHNPCAASSDSICATPLHPRLGELLTGMLCEMSNRGQRLGRGRGLRRPDLVAVGALSGLGFAAGSTSGRGRMRDAAAELGCRRDGDRRLGATLLLTAEADSEALAPPSPVGLPAGAGRRIRRRSDRAQGRRPPARAGRRRGV